MLRECRGWDESLFYKRRQLAKMGQDAIKWDKIGYDGLGWDTIRREMMGWSGVGLNGMGCVLLLCATYNILIF